MIGIGFESRDGRRHQGKILEVKGRQVAAMASFLPVFEETMKAEGKGKWTNDPKDKGGETFSGISRRFWPRWPWWPTIDAAKADPSFPDNLPQIPGLMDGVRQFYKERFWDPVWGDRIPDQDIARELFDTGVNLGSKKAVEFLQHAINKTNRNDPAKFWPEVAKDGKMGPGTLAALEKAVHMGNGRILFNIANLLQGLYYLERMEEDPAQERFIGWFERVEIRKRMGD